MRYLALFLMLVSLCAFTVGCAGEKPAPPVSDSPVIDAGGEEVEEEAVEEEAVGEEAPADPAAPAAQE